MTNDDASTWWSRPAFRITAFLLFGFSAGVAWFAALMPVGALGALNYDLSRYGFAASVLVALTGLVFRPWRQYGLVVFFLGLLLGISSWVLLTPVGIQWGGMLVFVLTLFGFPLARCALMSVGFWLAWRRTERRAGSAGETTRPASAPRRFGIGTLLIVVLAVSLIFSAAKQLDLPPTLSLWTGAFLSIIGGLQMVMSDVPRAASVATGAVLLPVTLAASWTAMGTNLPPAMASLLSTPADVAFVGAHLAAVGGVFGYIGGVLVAGLFLVIDLASRSRRHRSAAEPPV